MRLPQTFWVFVVSAAVLVAGVATGYQFMPAADGEDGFSMQIAYVGSLLQGGELLASLDEGLLLLVHAGRVAAGMNW